MTSDDPRPAGEAVVAHNHASFDIKAVGECPACDLYGRVNWLYPSARPVASGGATDREREVTVSVSECTPYGTCPVHGNSGHTRWGASAPAPVASHGGTTDVTEPPSRSYFAWADAHRKAALHSLRMALMAYKQANLPVDIKAARITALDAKIDALSAIELNDAAYPWSEDGVL